MDLKIVESNFIFSIYKDLELFDEVENTITLDDFELKESKLYYSILVNMIKQRYESIDEVSLENYLSDKPATKELFDKYGGYNTIEEIKLIVNIKNFEKYKDDLLKNNVLKKLKSIGFDVSDKKFLEMSSNDIYDFYEHQLNDVFIKVEKSSKIENFELTEKYLDLLDSGIGIGASIAQISPRLNYLLAGLRTKEVGVIAGISGAGKSSLMTYGFILPLVKQKIECCLISNEMLINKFLDMTICSVLYDEFHYYKITRKRLKAGNFNKEEKEMLKKAQDFININYKPYLKFVRMNSQKNEETFKILKKLSREGVKFFFYDVFKADDMSDRAYIGEMVQFSKNISELVVKLDIGFVMTQQIASYKENVRYLSRGCLSGSKQIIETVDFLLLMRYVWDDEYMDEKYDITPYNFKKDSNGNYMKDDKKHAVKEIVELDRDNRNFLLFCDKNRNGEDKEVIVYKQIGNYNIWRELAFANVSYVNRQ